MSLSQEAPTTQPPVIPHLELFEPAMCCSTGVCGPSVDTELIGVRDDLRWAEAQGASVARHNLSSDPDAFVANAKVSGLMQAFAEKALPALLVGGEVALHGRYPTRQELGDLIASSGAPSAGLELPHAESSCGCGPGGC